MELEIVHEVMCLGHELFINNLLINVEECLRSTRLNVMRPKCLGLVHLLLWEFNIGSSRQVLFLKITTRPGL